jgi:hypothetical protein
MSIGGPGSAEASMGDVGPAASATRRPSRPSTGRRRGIAGAATGAVGAAAGALVGGVKKAGQVTIDAAETVKDAAGTVVEKISEKMPFGDKEDEDKI